MSVQRLAKAILTLTALSLSLVAQAEFRADAPTVLVTGSNRGIGFEFVRQYSEAGWNVIATCRSPEKAEVLNAFAADNPQVIVERLDLIDHAGIDALAVEYAEQPIDILVNNAGLMRGPDKGQMVGSIDYDEFDRFYRINAAGPLKVSEAFYPNLLLGEQKVVAALTTGRGQKGIPFPGFTLYKTSKAALDSIQKEMALRWKRKDIKVVTLLPGRVPTRGEDTSVAAMNYIPVEDSVAGMIDIIDEYSIENSGRTIQWDGEWID